MALTVTTESQKKATAVGEEPDRVSVNMVIRQDPFQITLDASALLAVSILLVLGMHFMERTVLEMMIVSVPILLLV